jgi:hypothetical protein
MICAVCYGVLRGHVGSQWRGTFDLHFDHHSNRKELQNSASMSCCICRSLWAQVLQLEQKHWSGYGKVLGEIYNSFYQLIWGPLLQTKLLDSNDGSRFLSAYLSENYGEEDDGRLNGTYRLDFKLKDTERVGTFVLKQIGERHYELW